MLLFLAQAEVDTIHELVITPMFLIYHRIWEKKNIQNLSHEGIIYKGTHLRDFVPGKSV